MCKICVFTYPEDPGIRQAKKHVCIDWYSKTTQISTSPTPVTGLSTLEVGSRHMFQGVCSHNNLRCCWWIEGEIWITTLFPAFLERICRNWRSSMAIWRSRWTGKRLWISGVIGLHGHDWADSPRLDQYTSFFKVKGGISGTTWGIPNRFWCYR